MKYIYNAFIILACAGVVILFFITKDNPDFDLLWKLLFWMAIVFVTVFAVFEKFDPGFIGLVKTDFLFRILGKFRDPNSAKVHRLFMKRIDNLREHPVKTAWGRMKRNWEISLLEDILTEVGYYKTNVHGKYNHKITWKYRLKGTRTKFKDVIKS